METKIVLTIAGSDPSGGAGVQADLKTLADLGVTGISAITAITAQDDNQVIAIHPTPADILTQQLSTACKGRTVSAIKIGMVATRANARAITWFLKWINVENVIVDPVLHSSSGFPLLEADAYTFYRQQLLPHATVITPNLAEATAFAGMHVSDLDMMRKAAEIIHKETARLRGGIKKPLAVIIKGGHLGGDPVDILYDGEKSHSFPATRIPGKSPRGTGCRFASAIAAYLALGYDLHSSIPPAKEYMAKYIKQQQLHSVT